ncbi:phosphoserine aminotransferase-like isoform X1 [Diorhabda carinulata]|uniref:phosphoserine aminotransferase-like isoform X1 n=2 Tax=Diorhabda carinulata TaxID=1163345 RepID=UPI0025A24181|nr:phosphoserine aminotransferase-like isoform X1 [Diorhabda carinulata]
MDDSNFINFGAGPTQLPKQVLEEIQSEMLSYENIGISIIELSHRSTEFGELNKKAQETLRNLLNIPSNYKVLFVPGGGQGAFSAIPINLIGKTGSADYLVTGTWSKIAAEEAKKYGNINIAVKLDTNGSIPDPKTWKLDPNASYVFYCDNDTIDGVEFPFVPDTNNVPLVVDMCSNLLTKQIDVSKFGVIFAASQKNLGTAGIAVIIIRDDLLGYATGYCPSTLNFTLLNQYNSILNTPPIFPIYVTSKIVEWVKQNGGLVTMESQCREKSNLIYQVIDNSNDFYYTPVDKNVRSRINIPFRIGGSGGDEELEKIFLEEAKTENMIDLKGHRLVGGIRVSLYNAITIENVKKLVAFMIYFKDKYGNK